MLCKIKSVVIYILLVYITSIKALSPVQINNTNVNITSRSNRVAAENVPSMPIEGGGKLLPPPTNVTIIPGPNLDSVSDIKPQISTTTNAKVSKDNKEGSSASTTAVVSEGGGQSIIVQSLHNNITLEPVQHSNIPSPNNVTNINPSTTNVAMEGGGKPTKANNPYLKVNDDTIPKKSDVVASITPERTIPVSEAAESSRQKIAPRKGVNNLDYSEFKKLENSTKKPVVMKPLITEASEDEPFEVNLDVNSKTNSTTPIEEKPKVPSLDSFNEFSNNTQKYVIPIVIVILSVPLVTILISFLLKRGAEWWKYRHYRRMDFLINGIYDT